MHKKKTAFFLCVYVFVMPLKMASATPDECVILLHGMGRTKHSMELIEKELQKQHYSVWNESYPSTSKTIPNLSLQTIGQGCKFCQNKDKVHFVTHSLGGILVRYYLQENRIKNLGKIVMISPPNKGSEVADMLKDNLLYKKITGPPGQSLGTGIESIPKKLKRIPGVIGIIAGEFSSDPWFSPFIPGQDDGKVSVESAKLDEMADFLVVNSGHTLIMRKALVIDQVVYFLKHGRFKKLK
jgi:triacylglycerol lipase